MIFREHTIRPESLVEVDLTGGSKALVELSFNLYNNHPCGTVVELFASLDESNRILAVEAIKIRFGVKESGGTQLRGKWGQGVME